MGALVPGGAADFRPSLAWLGLQIFLFPVRGEGDRETRSGSDRDGIGAAFVALGGTKCCLPHPTHRCRGVVFY